MSHANLYKSMQNGLMPAGLKGHPDRQLPEGRHWELTSYEWNERTGYAKFQYTHRFTGKLHNVTRWQPEYMAVDQKGKKS